MDKYNSYQEKYRKNWERKLQEIFNYHKRENHGQPLDPEQDCLTVPQLQWLYDREEGLCACCQKPLEEFKWTFDHIVPISKGGHTNVSNGQILCSHCNSSKKGHIIKYYRGMAMFFE